MAVSIGVTERGDAALNDGWKDWVYKEHKPAILITKNPKKLIENNKDLFFKSDSQPGNIILHATITGLGSTPIEPNVPDYKESLNYIKSLIDQDGFQKDRIVIRNDPIILPFVVNDINYKNTIIEIAKFAKDNGLRYRTSFLDYYPHTKDRFEEVANKNPDWAEKIAKLNTLQPTLHASIELRKAFIDVIIAESGLLKPAIEICGEPLMECSGCVSLRDFATLDIVLEDDIHKGFQRPACMCIGSKKELLDNKYPCAHKCVYCYWKDKEGK